MIRRIQLIKSFGIFSDFRWPNRLADFKRFNLIYGWNYSGKTTLSRTLRCFELQQPHADFPGAQVELMAEDAVVHSLAAPNSAPLLRVFNSDFIRENLSFDAGSATPILILGAEDIAKQKILKEKQAERDALVLQRTTDKRARETQVTALEKLLSNGARDLIKNPLGVPNYERPHFQAKVEACKLNPDSYLLSDETLEQQLLLYHSRDKKPPLVALSVALSPMDQLTKTASAILARVVTANNPIQRLKQDPELENWVNKGRLLHNGKDLCQFCGQHLPRELLKQLQGHFSDDYQDLMRELNAMVNKIEQTKDESLLLPHKSDLYPELSSVFSLQKSQLEHLVKARHIALTDLLKAVTDKQTKAFTPLVCPPVADNEGQILATIDAINKTIAEHNLRTASFDDQRKEAFAELEKHYAAGFVCDHKYTIKLHQIAELKKSVAAHDFKLSELALELRTLESELSEASKGAERINALLGQYFSRHDLRIAVSADKRFEIIRGDAVARNLSEGEKTAIAFAYFITRVQDGRNPLTNTIVVIDDPISSLDANHLFNTYALIKTQLATCHQLIISTHSFEFYNLIREWVSDDEKDTKKPQVDWKVWGVFLVRRTDSGGAVLEEIPKELLRFKSEYHYLFSTLHHFNTAPTGDFDCLLSLPNVVRRFMEAFGGIMIPRWTGLHAKMPKLFPNEIERERVWKFINHYSHNTTITRSLTIPDTSECKAVVQACLNAVRTWDHEYFSELEAEVH